MSGSGQKRRLRTVAISLVGEEREGIFTDCRQPFFTAHRLKIIQTGKLTGMQANTGRHLEKKRNLS